MESLVDPATLAARAVTVCQGQVPEDLNFRLGIEVRDLWSYTVTFSGGRISISENLDCDISVHLGAETAQEIASGRINAQQAIDSGQMKIGGRLAMIPVTKALSTLDALLSKPPETPQYPKRDR